MAATEGEFVQFVCFKTAGSVPVELFHESWIPISRSFIARGINTVILSQNVGFVDLCPYTFVSKNVWDSMAAVKSTFPEGLPPQAGRGHITVNQGGIFQVVPWKGTDTEKHKTKVKDSLKLLAMISLHEAKKVESQALTMEFAEDMSNMKGFSSLCLYKLHPCAGTDLNEWMFDWVIEAYFDKDINEDSILKSLEKCGRLGDRRWEIGIHKDAMQLSP